ncbi:MAG: DNA repair protein RecN [Alcanivoracaceae bacterium]|nr:DNA repair protein RecN [Alcanivoracaceae bacterium]
MLKSLFIKNYVLIKQLDLDFTQGFHAFTGETGAGKSIIVGALSLILGNRADYSVIRNKEKKCEISALFDISNNNAVKQWLAEQDVEHNNEIECRRVITVDGRSKSWLNTRPCTNASLKQLGSLLVQIHGQHDQIKLNNAKYQLSIIDDAGQYQSLLKETENLSHRWHQINSELRQIELAGALNESDSQLLRYQYEELSQLNLREHELDGLHTQQKSLTNAVNTIAGMDRSLALLAGDNESNSNISDDIAEIMSSLSEIQAIDLVDILNMLDEVSINLNEIESQLQSKHDGVEVNPEKLTEVENRLEQIYQTARKHSVNAEILYQHQLDLSNKLELNDSQKQQRDKLLEDKLKLETKYAKQSQLLSQSRLSTALSFQQKVTKVVQQMGLNKAQFIVNIKHNPELPINKLGQNNCDFEVIMNVGQAPQKMSATASGGELSRIALAIEICKKQDLQSSSFVFDEVDAGIGGAVAETVGKLMRKLSDNQQVFAVTHLPHVAGLAHHHYLVSKAEINGLTESSVELLNIDQRVHELARMSGGSQITETTLEQAKAFMLVN